MEFTEVMRCWRRMCEHYTKDDAASCCNGCPMDGRGCSAIYENGNAEPEIIEREVQRWAAEHPEMVYPTVYEWLVSIGLLGNDMWSMSDVYKPIPADIAEKLGIEPKEVE